MTHLALIPIFALLQSPAAAEPRIQDEARALIRELQTGNARQRREAKRRLIELGFQAREEVRAGMKHADPEVAAACSSIWIEIEAKVGPVEIPGLAPFIASLRDKRLDQASWGLLLKSQGPAALGLLSDYLSLESFPDEEGQEVSRRVGQHYIRSEGAFSRAQKLSVLFDSLLASPASLRQWALASPEQRAVFLKFMHLRQPEIYLREDRVFLEILAELEPEALLPYLDRQEGLFSIETARLLQSQKVLLARLKTQGGRIGKRVMLLPFLLAEGKESKARALAALQDDFFSEEPHLLRDFLVALGDAGLAAESHRFSCSDEGLQSWRRLVAEIRDGKVDDISAAIRAIDGIDQNQYNNRSQNGDLAVALLGDGDPARRRHATYLFSHYDDDLYFAGLRSELLGRARVFGRNRQGVAQVCADHYKATPGEAVDAFSRYLNASLRRDAKAGDHLEAAVKAAPQCLPILLEKFLASAPEARSAALEAALATTVKQADLALWLLRRLEAESLKIPAPVLQKWVKDFDFASVNGRHVFLDRLIRTFVESRLDPALLLPHFQEASLNRALLLLAAKQPEDAQATCRQLGAEEEIPGLFLLELLGGARKESSESSLLSARAGLDGQPVCPDVTALHGSDFWSVGKDLRLLISGAAVAQTPSKDQQRHYCNCLDSWVKLRAFFVARPDLLPGKK
ncbi:MAG: hypothetical protein RL095_3282 [Verrucomicrobiota bacterium]|jgi:hypothetical protein